MPVTSGQLTLPDQYAPALLPFADKVAKTVGLRIKPVIVMVKARADMPRYRDPRPADGPTDGKSRGFWRAKKRTILLADDLFTPGQPLEETLGHEIVHAMFEDGIPDKAKMLPLLVPEPENFSDTMVNGKDRGYAGTPEEAVAVYGSAALFGFTKPAYTDLFKRSVPTASFPTLKADLLGPVTPEPEPDPVDPCQAIKDKLAQIAQIAQGV